MQVILVSFPMRKRVSGEVLRCTYQEKVSTTAKLPQGCPESSQEVALTKALQGTPKLCFSQHLHRPTTEVQRDVFAHRTLHLKTPKLSKPKRAPPAIWARGVTPPHGAARGTSPPPPPLRCPAHLPPGTAAIAGRPPGGGGGDRKPRAVAQHPRGPPCWRWLRLPLAGGAAPPPRTHRGRPQGPGCAAAAPAGRAGEGRARRPCREGDREPGDGCVQAKSLGARGSRAICPWDAAVPVPPEFRCTLGTELGEGGREGTCGTQPPSGLGKKELGLRRGLSGTHFWVL